MDCSRNLLTGTKTIEQSKWDTFNIKLANMSEVCRHRAIINYQDIVVHVCSQKCTSLYNRKCKRTGVSGGVRDTWTLCTDKTLVNILCGFQTCKIIHLPVRKSTGRWLHCTQPMELWPQSDLSLQMTDWRRRQKKICTSVSSLKPSWELRLHWRPPKLLLPQAWAQWTALRRYWGSDVLALRY